MSETNGTTPLGIGTLGGQNGWVGHGGAMTAPRVVSERKRGFLVLADISGFTAFVTATEIEHGPPIIAALLEEVIRRIAPPLQIQDIEGDAVFALGAQSVVAPPTTLLTVVPA